MSAARAKAIFLDAIEAPAARREAVVRSACGSDGRLADRVRALLSAHERAGAVIVEPTGPIGEREPSVRPSADATAIGAVIGPYTIERTLGEGGFGVVYEARQESPVRRQVAIKIMHAGLNSRDVIARFEAERQALAVMDHPGIARVFDAGTTTEGRPYFVMECFDGLSITEFCDGQRLGLRDRIELFEQVCMAVQHAHSKGVIHRDLKPSNIMVARIDGRPFAKVIDFGIAKAVHTPLVADAAVTLPSQVVGTPLYMAPEQASPHAPDIDARADVYSLGVVLYELLSGAPPFDHERLRNLRLSELERVITHEDPPRPSARAESLPLERRREVAAARGLDDWRLPRALETDLDWIVMRAIEKQRDRRYGAPLALAGDLRRYLRNEPVEAGPPTASYRMAKFARRHRVEFAAAGAVVLAMLAFIAGSAWFAWREHRAADRAQRQLVRANALAEFAQGIIRGVDPAEARGKDTTLLRQILDDAAQRVETDLADHPEAAVSMLNTVGAATLQIAEHERAERIFRRAMTTARERLGPDAPLTLDATENLGATLTAMNRFSEGAPLLTHVADARTRSLGPEHPHTLKAVSNLAYLYDRAGEWSAALPLLERLLEARRRTLGPTHDQTLLTMNNLANTLESLGRTAEALPMLERVLETQAAVHGDDHPRVLQTMNNLAGAYRLVGRTDDAIDLHARSLAAKRRVLPEHHPSLVVTLINMGSLLIDLGRLDDAGPILEEAVASARLGDSGSRMHQVGSLNALGRLHRASNRPDLAASSLTEAVEIARQILPRHHPSMLSLLGNLAASLLDAGDAAAAERAAGEGVEICTESLGLSHASAALPRLTFGRALIALGRIDEGVRILTELAEDAPSFEAARPGFTAEVHAAIESARQPHAPADPGR